jgi:hypothetical protein
MQLSCTFKQLSADGKRPTIPPIARTLLPVMPMSEWPVPVCRRPPSRGRSETSRYALQRRIARGLPRVDVVAVARQGEQSSEKAAQLVGIGDAGGPDYFSM